MGVKKDEFFIYGDLAVQYKFTNSMSLIGYNMRERRPIIGLLSPAPMAVDKSIGLSIRKAMSYAIDRVEINNIVFNNENEIISSPLHPSMGVWLNPEMISYCHNLDAARTFIHIAAFDIAWCGPSEPLEWPEWDTLCSGTIPISLPTSISVNGISTIITFTILVSLSGFYIRRKKKSKSVNIRD